MKLTLEKIFTVKDIAKAVGRDRATILRWEREELIPKAKRDRGGNRYYSEREALSVLDAVKKNHFFRRKNHK